MKAERSSFFQGFFGGLRFFPADNDSAVERPSRAAALVRERMEKGFELDRENFARDRANVYGDMERAFKKVK